MGAGAGLARGPGQLGLAVLLVALGAAIVALSAYIAGALTGLASYVARSANVTATVAVGRLAAGLAELGAVILVVGVALAALLALARRR